MRSRDGLPWPLGVAVLLLGACEQRGAVLIELPAIIDLGDGGAAVDGGDVGHGWSGAGLASLEILALLVDPTEPQNVYAGTPQGIYRTPDRGATWIATGRGGRVQGLAAAPTTPATIYAATTEYVLKSVDRGQNWTSMSAGLPTNWAVAVVVDPARSDVAYAGTSSGVYKTTDGGANWRSANVGMATSPGVTALAIAPSAPLTLYAATVGGVFRSSDGAGGWIAVGSTLGVPITAVAIDARDAQTVYTIAGRTLSRSRNAGIDWFTILSGADVVAVDPKEPSTIYAAASSAYRSTNRGTDWTLTAVGLSGTATSIAIDPQQPSTIYLGTLSGVFRTLTGGL